MSALAVILASLVILAILIRLIEHRVGGLNKQFYKQRWLSIQTTSKQNEAGLRLAIIDSDKLLDRVLKERRYAGETMGERLKAAGGALGNQDAVWSAHKLRNKLVHEDTKKPRPNYSRQLAMTPVMRSRTQLFHRYALPCLAFCRS